MIYKNVYYKQYQKKADELHQLILDEFKKAKAKMKNFEFAKKVILKKLADIENKSLDDSEENIRWLLDTYFLRTEYQRGSEDLIFENELKEKYDELKEKLSFSNYNSFLKTLANYHVTLEIKINFESYWSNLRSMYRLDKFKGYESFKKFDLIQLRKDGNQAISKELHEIERLKLQNPEFSIEQLIILNQNPEGIQVENKKTNQKLNPAKFNNKSKNSEKLERLENLQLEKFYIKEESIKLFEMDELYDFVTDNFFEKESLNKSEFQNLFIRGKTLGKPIITICSNQLLGLFLKEVSNHYEKFILKHFIENQQFIPKTKKNHISTSNISNSTTAAYTSANYAIYKSIIDTFKTLKPTN